MGCLETKDIKGEPDEGHKKNSPSGTRNGSTAAGGAEMVKMNKEGISTSNFVEESIVDITKKYDLLSPPLGSGKSPH